MPFIKGEKFSRDSNGKYSDFVQLSFKLGIVNKVNAHNLPEGALLDAINVDIDNQGKVKRRKNYKKIISGNCNSLFSDSNGIGYMIKNNVLVKINQNFTTKVIENGFPPNTKLSYCEVNQEIYYSDSNNTTGKINKHGNYDKWSLDSPQMPPIVIQTQEDGGLKAGKYLVCYTYLYGTYETGCSQYNAFTVEKDGSSLFVECFPNSFSTNANIYITPINSEIAGLHSTGYTATISDTNSLKRNIKKEVATGFPALSNLSYSNGRIFGTRDNYIFWTLPLDYRQFEPAKNGLAVDTPILIFVSVQEGFWVVTQTSTYFLKGNDTESMVLELMLPYGAIKGTLFYDEDKKTVGWLSTNGYIVADGYGKIENLTSNTVDFPKNYINGAALFRKDNGIKQVIFSLVGEGQATSYETKEYRDNQYDI